MKFALALLALVVTTTAYRFPNVGRGELAAEVQDFLDIIPQDEIVKITLQYCNEDAEFKAMIEYFKSEEFKQLAKEVQNLPEVKDLMEYIYCAGLEVYQIVDEINKWLKILPFSRINFAGRKQITGGIQGYVDDILAILPNDEIDALYEKKMQDSSPFIDFISQLQSENFRKIINQVYCNTTFLNLLEHAKNVGIDLILIKNLIERILGVFIPSPDKCLF